MLPTTPSLYLKANMNKTSIYYNYFFISKTVYVTLSINTPDFSPISASGKKVNCRISRITKSIYHVGIIVLR